MKAFLIIEGLWAIVDPDNSNQEMRSRAKDNEKAGGQIIVRLELFPIGCQRVRLCERPVDAACQHLQGQQESHMWAVEADTAQSI